MLTKFEGVEAAALVQKLPLRENLSRLVKSTHFEGRIL